MSGGDVVTAAATAGRLGASPDEVARLRVGWELLNRADEVSVAAFAGGRHATSFKPDGSPATDVDAEIERLLVDGIRANFGGDAVMGEEFGGTSTGRSRWMVDPIDGTANFVEGVPIYAHMLAWARDDEVRLSIVSAPVLRRRWWAVRDVGAFLHDRLISVSTVDSLAAARIAHGGLRDYDERAAAGMFRLLRRCVRARGFGNFLPHMLVAEGSYDLATSGDGGQEWDVAPLALIVAEAGGRLTSLSGARWREGDAVLTANSALHATAVDVVGMVEA